jgi:hypothetical protein
MEKNGLYIYTSSDYGKEWIIVDSRSSEDNGLNADETGYVIGGAVGLILITVALLLLYYFRCYHRLHKEVASTNETSVSSSSSSSATDIINTISTTTATNTNIYEYHQRNGVGNSSKYLCFVDQSDEEYYPFDFNDNDEHYITNPLTAYRYSDDDETDHILRILMGDEYTEFCYDDADVDDGSDDEDEDYDYREETNPWRPFDPPIRHFV